MTTIDQAREAVQEHFVANWPDERFVFENEHADEANFAGQTWVRLSFRNLDGFQQTLGGIGHRIYDRIAKVYVQVMAPVGKGMKAGADVAHAARALFEGVRIGELVGFGGVVRETKPDGKWYVTTVEVAFQYYEQK